MANHRDRSFLDLAHEIHECQNCGRYVDEGCEPAHQNGINAGKGQGIKGKDSRHAALCHTCHRWYDSGSVGKDPSGIYFPERDDKLDMFTRAYFRTQDQYWERGLVQVTPKNERTEQ